MAKERDIDPNLVAAVIWVESRGNPSAHSGSDARGLMQIVPKWHPNCEADRLYEPEYNIRCGVKILSSNIRRYGLKEGLGRYYSGGNSSHWKIYYTLIFRAMNRFSKGQT